MCSKVYHKRRAHTQPEKSRKDTINRTKLIEYLIQKIKETIFQKCASGRALSIFKWEIASMFKWSITEKGEPYVSYLCKVRISKRTEKSSFSSNMLHWYLNGSLLKPLMWQSKCDLLPKRATFTAHKWKACPFLGEKRYELECMLLV